MRDARHKFHLKLGQPLRTPRGEEQSQQAGSQDQQNRKTDRKVPMPRLRGHLLQRSRAVLREQEPAPVMARRLQLGRSAAPKPHAQHRCFSIDFGEVDSRGIRGIDNAAPVTTADDPDVIGHVTGVKKMALCEFRQEFLLYVLQIEFHDGPAAEVSKRPAHWRRRTRVRALHVRREKCWNLFNDGLKRGRCG